MNTKLTAILLAFVVLLLTGFKPSETLHFPGNLLQGSENTKTSETQPRQPAETIPHQVKFRQLTSTIKSDTSAVIEIKIDNGERERDFTAHCTLSGDSVLLRVEIPAWYFNYTKTFTASIPIK
jgi:hypothetical protein